MKAEKQQETIERIEKFYKAYNNGLPFEYTYVDEQYQAQYAAEQRVAVLSRYFAGVAILISCLGLFGLAAFTAQRRRKEIGIRKVLGLSEVGIFVLLSREFIQIVLISILIALPVSFLLTREWLHSFAFQIDLAWWYFAIAGLAALLIAWFTVGMQAIKAAKVNPIQSLKEE
jgi:ABC-type antimicrobial peptide transport system permease subunit